MALDKALFAYLWLLCVLLSGCNRYALTVNNNEIYRPAPLYSDFEIADVALDTCIRQAIADKRVVEAAQLINLRCTHGGIKNLQGIGHFAWLSKVDLSHNDIADSAPLAQLQRLEFLKLVGNPNLNCTSARSLGLPLGDSLILPEHCYMQ